MSRPLVLEFVRSAPGIEALGPPSGPEVAVAGRSNVGKSSLVNALANRRHLAQVSKTPGRTRHLNLYARRGGGALVDLPGYGYAAVPERVRSRWPEMIEGYLLGRKELVMVLALVDGEIGPAKLDVALLEWLRSHGLPHTVVATKWDKVKPSRRARRAAELARGCGVEPEDVVWVSVVDGTGLDRLRSLIRGWLEPR